MQTLVTTKRKKNCQFKKKMLCTNRVTLIRYNFISKIDFFFDVSTICFYRYLN